MGTLHHLHAEVKDLTSFYPRLTPCVGGESLIEKIGLLKTLKGRLL